MPVAIRNPSLSNLNYYLSKYYLFFAVTGYTGTNSNYTTHTLLNDVLSVVGSTSDPAITKLYIEDTYNGDVYSYLGSPTSPFTGNDSIILNQSFTHSLLIYPVTQKSKSISVNMYNKDLSPITNLQLNVDYLDITQHTLYTLNASFIVNTNGVALNTQINSDWEMYINGITASNKNNNLVTSNGTPINMYDTDIEHMTYTFSTINDLMQMTYSIIYKPSIDINNTYYSPNFYYVNTFHVNPNLIIASASISFTCSSSGTYSYGIDNLVYSTTASGRRYATIEWSYNSGGYNYFTTSVSKSLGNNVYNINTNGTIDYSPIFPYDTFGKTYSFRVSATTSNYTTPLFIPSVYTFSIVYGQ